MTVRLVVLLPLLFAGCATPRASVRVMRYTSEAFSPTSPSSVEVYRTSLVRRPYIELAELSLRVNKRNRDIAVSLLREKAAELGANALIVIGERPVGAVAVPVGQLAVAVQLKEIYGVAIRYK